jgi:hypothetical protein
MPAPKVIWKYPLTTGSQWLMLPAAARPLTVQMVQGTPYLWVEVDPVAPLEHRTVYGVRTGDVLPTVPLEYIATIQMDVVRHYFITKDV